MDAKGETGGETSDKQFKSQQEILILPHPNPNINTKRKININSLHWAVLYYSILKGITAGTQKKRTGRLGVCQIQSFFIFISVHKE